MKARKYRLAGKRKPEQDLFFKQALEARGWKLGDDQDWNTCWFTGMPDAAEFRKVGPGRTINHIPGNNALTIKSRLYQSVSRMRDRVSEQFGPGHEALARLEFLPRVYSMPGDYHLLQQAALDDPGQRWILKPKNASRGRGIRVVSDIAQVPMDSSWMVQQYLANPHIMRQRKYVLRLYVLVSSIDPLRVYLHRQGFAKLASAPYDVNDVDNPFSQLTNPDINALNGGVEVPVEFVDLDRYRQWLRELGHDDEQLFERIRDLVTLTVISAVESMRRQSADCGADTRGCYELLGLDCLIDDQLKPWILECNLSPSLGVCAAPDGGGDIEERVKAEVVSDTVGLVGIDSPPEPSSAERDPVGHARLQADEEHSRAGGFQRLWPSEQPERYLPYFALPRLVDMTLADACSAAPVTRPQLVRREAEELIVEDRLGLYDQRSGRLDWLNESASLIWLMAMQGANPDAIAEQLHNAAIASGSGAVPDRWTVRRDVWDCLADWAESGRIMQRAAGAGSQRPPVSATVPASEIFAIGLQCGACRLDVRTGSPPVAARLESALGLLRSDGGGPEAPQLQVVCDTPGYTLVLVGDVIASRLTLAAVVHAVAERLLRMAADEGGISLDAGLLTGLRADAGPSGVVFASPGLDDGFALQVAARLQQDFSRGVRLDARSSGRAAALGLPGRRGKEVVPARADGPRGWHAVDALVIGRTGQAPDADAIAVLTAQEALSELLPLCSMSGGRPLDAGTLSALVEWLESRRLYALDTSDYDTAFRALDGLLPQSPVAGAPARCDSTRRTQESTA